MVAYPEATGPQSFHPRFLPKVVSVDSLDPKLVQDPPPGPDPTALPILTGGALCEASYSRRSSLENETSVIRGEVSGCRRVIPLRDGVWCSSGMAKLPSKM